MQEEELLKNAIQIATEAHKNQVDKSGGPYIGHIRRVMSRGATTDEKIVGILHDVVEDIDWTFEKLAQWDSKDVTIKVGDCIYDYSSDDKNPVLRKSIHTQKNVPKDLSGKNVLMSNHFYYFGSKPIPLPTSLLKIVRYSQGHKSTSNDAHKNEFIKWIESCADYKNNVNAPPFLLMNYKIIVLILEVSAVHSIYKWMKRMSLKIVNNEYKRRNKLAKFLPRNFSKYPLCVGKGHCGNAITKAQLFFQIFIHASKESNNRKDRAYFVTLICTDLPRMRKSK